MNILEVGSSLVRQAIDVAVTRKGIETEKAVGEAEVDLIESSAVTPQKRPGPSQSWLGQLTDFYA